MNNGKIAPQFLLLIVAFLTQFCLKVDCKVGSKYVDFQHGNCLKALKDPDPPFKMHKKFEKTSKNSRAAAILTSDREVIKDGGEITITAELVEIETSVNDYFTIQCGPALDDTDILCAVAPTASSISPYFAEASFSELTFMRCDYKFSYISVDSDGLATKIGELVVRNEDLPTVPKQPHLVYPGNPTSMKVMYISSSDSPMPSVKYWRSEESEDLAMISTQGSSATYTAADLCDAPANQDKEKWANAIGQQWFRDPGFTHTVEMVDLLPDNRYSYRVGNDQHGWSEVFSFMSAPNSQKPIRFLAFGDADIEEAAKNTSYFVKKEIDENGSAFTLHFGDLGYADGNAWVWDRWGSIISPGAASAPYMTTGGNHEMDYSEGQDPTGEGPFKPDWWAGGDSKGECGVPLFVRWGSAMPKDNHGGGGNKMWYSFDWGNLHVAMMDAEHDWQMGSNQYSWLEADLAAVDRNKTPWLVVTSHRPVYTTPECEQKTHFISEIMQENLNPLFEKYQVNLVLAGHAHWYQRLCSVRGGKCVDDLGGTTHVTIGSAGKYLDSCPFSPDSDPYSRAATLQWGYVRIDAGQNQMKCEFVLDADGSVWDSFEVNPWNNGINGNSGSNVIFESVQFILSLIILLQAILLR